MNKNEQIGSLLNRLIEKGCCFSIKKENTGNGIELRFCRGIDWQSYSEPELLSVLRRVETYILGKDLKKLNRKKQFAKERKESNDVDKQKEKQ